MQVCGKTALSYCNWTWNCKRKQYSDQMFLLILTPPPFSLPFWQAAEECCVALALYVNVTRLTRPKLSVFAREWIVHPWWRLFAARIPPPTPMSVSLRKPSATHSDALRCCARDPAVSNISCQLTNQQLLETLAKDIHFNNPISFWVWKLFLF